MPFQRNLSRLWSAVPEGGFRVWGRTLVAVVALAAPTLTAIPAGAGVPGVILTVVGGGTVAASSGGDCTSATTCTYTGFPVSFTAKPVVADGANAGWKFTGWTGGGCSGTGICTFNSGSDPAYTVTATFVKIWSLSVTIVGSGRITGPGISCSTGDAGTCRQTYTDGSSLTLTSSPVAGYSFAGWSGDGTGTAGRAVEMTGNRAVTATFSCDTEPQADPLAEAMRNASSTVDFGDLGSGDRVRGCYVALPPLGTPNASSSSELAGFPTDGATYGVLTTGSAAAASTSNSNYVAGAVEPYVGGTGSSLGGPNVRGSFDLDVTILRVDFKATAEACLSIDFQFLTEEFGDELSYNDAFVAEVDSSSWYTEPDGSGDAIVIAEENIAFGANLSQVTVEELQKPPIQSNSDDLTSTSAAGTTYDGATTVLQARTPVSQGAHALFLSIFDVGDRGLDSAVFLDALTLETLVGGECSQGATDVKYPLVVKIDPTGGGTVDAGEDFTCPTTSCGKYYLASSTTTVPLFADAAVGYRFDHWSGDCSGEGPCSVTMGDTPGGLPGGPRSVEAHFTRQFRLTASGLTASPSASYGVYDEDTVVTVRSGSTVTGWFGCSEIVESGQACRVVMNHDRTVSASTTSAAGGLSLSVTGVPTEGTGSGERVSYAVNVKNNSGGSLTPSLRVDFSLSDGLPLSTAPSIISSGCSLGSGYDYVCTLPSLGAGASQTFALTIDAPLVSKDALLNAQFSVDGDAAQTAPTPGTSSMSTLIKARPPQDFDSGAMGAGLTTFDASVPVSDRNPTGTKITGGSGNGAIGEVLEAPPVASSVSTTSTKKSGGGTTTTTSGPVCDPTLPMTCWRFDLDFPTITSGRYTVSFVFDRTTFTNSDGSLKIGLRQVVIYHREDGKLTYSKLASCGTGTKLSYPCVSRVYLEAATGDLWVEVLTQKNGQWKGGR